MKHKFPIHNVMRLLAEQRPILRSAQDFRLAFHSVLTDLEIECEVGDAFGSQVDVWVEAEKYVMGLELMYNTQEIDLVAGDEVYSLKETCANDQGRRTYLTKVQRLEQLMDSAKEIGHDFIGYAILLTNDHAYWHPSDGAGQHDEAFHIHDGREVHGELEWGSDTSQDIMAGLDDPIYLGGMYEMRWRDYATVSDDTHGQFRYLVTKIG